MSPGRHGVSVYRNQVKQKKISAAGVTQKLLVTAVTWIEERLLEKG